ncbi:MAG: OB-fold domain-containing protein [Burkholderiaceae bacterium]|jgi:uncharacterized OB-fold protein
MPQSQSPLAVYLSYLRQGQLAYQYSPQAQRPVFFPRVICPFTGSDQLEWRVSAGLGTVYSVTVVFPKEGPEYNVALIDCDEGFRLMSRIHGVNNSEIQIGMRVSFTAFQSADDEDPYPVFVPLDKPAAAP